MIIIIVILVILLFIFVGISNNINKALNKIEEAKSGIEIQLIKRYDILKQSFDVAKNYAKHEDELFKGLRQVNRNLSVNEINEVVENQANAAKSLLALGEAYPELRSAELFSNLQKQLTEENAQFAAAKRALNANVTQLNNLVITFPSSVICSMKGVSKAEFIKEENLEAKKEINFDWGN